MYTIIGIAASETERIDRQANAARLGPHADHESAPLAREDRGKGLAFVHAIRVGDVDLVRQSRRRQAVRGLPIVVPSFDRQPSAVECPFFDRLLAFLVFVASLCEITGSPILERDPSPASFDAVDRLSLRAIRSRRDRYRRAQADNRNRADSHRSPSMSSLHGNQGTPCRQSSCFPPFAQAGRESCRLQRCRIRLGKVGAPSPVAALDTNAASVIPPGFGEGPNHADSQSGRAP